MVRQLWRVGVSSAPPFRRRASSAQPFKVYCVNYRIYDLSMYDTYNHILCPLYLIVLTINLNENTFY